METIKNLKLRIKKQKELDKKHGITYKKDGSIIIDIKKFLIN